MSWVQSYLPRRHRRWVDVFGGSGAVTINKPRSEIEVFNDLDFDVWTFLRVLRDNPTDLQKMLRSAKYHPSEDNFFKLREDRSEESGLDSAARFFMLRRASFSGQGHRRNRLSYGLTGDYGKQKLKTYFTKVDQLPFYSQRLQGVEIYNESFATIMPRLLTSPDDLGYLDPPYPSYMRTNRGQNAYDHEMSIKDHQEMLRLAKRSPAMIVIAGYDWNFSTGRANTVYRSELKGWHTVTLQTYSRAARWTPTAKGPDYREEVMWLNERAWESLMKYGAIDPSWLLTRQWG